jgi:glycosyltransferase involved in cell wall biosynthesis
MDVSVIVPARDAQATLGRTLDGLAAQEFDGSFEVIVVDNGSRDGTAELAADSEVVTRVIRRERGEGPGAARNTGAATSKAELLAFLDADCYPDPNWLQSGVRAMTHSDLVQGRVLPDPQLPADPFDRTLSVGGAHGLFESANLFVSRELFERLEGFPAGLESDGGAPFGEDVIFGWGAVRSGARTGFCEAALAYHEVFRRRPGEFVAERTRLALFPRLAASVPELRKSFFYHGLFHSRRSASFDLALVGLLLAAALRRRLPLAAVAPYAGMLASSARRWGLSRAPEVALVETLADGVGALALWRGSLASRSPLL